MTLWEQLKNALPDFPENKCRGHYDLFFPENAEELKRLLPQAQALCGSCIHQEDCLQFAIDNNFKSGIWGGFTPSQREDLLEEEGNGR